MSLALTLLGDSCSGIPGQRFEANLARIVARILERNAPADALLYLGDHVYGYTDDEPTLRAQWDHFLEHEFRPLDERYPRVLHIAGNHDANTPISAAFCEARMPIPPVARNRKGLNYVIDLGGAEIVVISTCDLANRGFAAVDMDWLAEALHSLSAPIRLVAGHYPFHAVNGYEEVPKWVFPADQCMQAWRLFREAGVKAYLCSHIIAFDVQVHEDIVQLCSGGAGTEFGPDGVMGNGEFRHFVTVTVSSERLAFEAIDENGRVRESGSHSFTPRSRLPSAAGTR
ncbi:MAG: hypothetical protein FJX60_04890 [Alphaproteobacteria bacterium]|nr:hypothetical protein [Alphaproteobacteria bacterium]